MAQNALAFDDYLKEQEIVLQKDSHEDDVLYVIHESVENVGPVSVMALFNDSDRFVTIICYKYLKFPAEKKPQMLELINALNAEYTMVKFVETAGAISVQVVVPFHDNFTPEVVIDMVSLLLQTMAAEHSRFGELLQ